MAQPLEIEAPVPAPSDGEEEGYPSRARAWWLVAVLTLASVSSTIDGSILSMMVGPVRRELGLSDTQISLLMGFAVAVLFAVMAYPIGRLADSRNRRSIIAVGIMLWSVTTLACGLVQSFAQFVIARVGLGIGKSALPPAALSMISDSFPKRRLATATSVFGFGNFLGSGLSIGLGGVLVGAASKRDFWTVPLLGAMRPWRTVFPILGVSGLLVLLLMYTLREPRRHGGGWKAQGAGGAVEAVPLNEVFSYLKANRLTFFCHILGFSLFALHNMAFAAWLPTFFIRTYGWTPAQVGMVYSPMLIVFGCLGVYTGGRLADRLESRGQLDAKLKSGLFAALAVIPFIVLYPLMPNGTASMIVLVPLTFLVTFPVGAAAAALLAVTPNPMRAQVSALYLLVVHLVSSGLGPTVVALLTDYVFHDDQALRYSLILMGVPVMAAAAVLLAIGRRPYRLSWQYCESWVAERGSAPAAGV
ncbi:MAG: MFS transporter [Thermoanaerobaculia bacterium]